ncbi:head-tail connector protein [Actinomadura sp. WMMA1423]|uniref:head-tail connector protein n=1 Tax=Actinomadura sp. WMMA1423 TaxID=2591108 RepID=UPI00114750BC|nr:head-tail connector protein [Actinomadura sp. WMMA1423]
MAATDLFTLEDAKAQLNIDPDNTDSDAELAGYISGVTRVVERYVGAVIHRTVTEQFDGGAGEVLLSNIPVASVTTVTDSGTDLEAGAYSATESGVLSRVAGAARTAFLPGLQSVQVVYVAGKVADTTAVKDELAEVRLAGLIILQHMWETQRPAAAGPFSQASDDFDPRYAYSVPRRAQELLGVEIGEWAGFA